MDIKDLYWLSGILEGEGSFMKGPPSSPNLPVVAMQTTDEDICERVANLFGVKYHPSKIKNSKWKQSYSVRITGTKAVEYMVLLKPLMGERRKGQIQNALDSYKKKERLSNSKINQDIVKNIREDFDNGMTLKTASIKYSLSEANLSKIKNRLIWV